MFTRATPIACEPQKPTFLLGLTILFLLASVALAAPFKRLFEYNQPDGSNIELWGEGDEFYAVFETLDGFSVVFDPATKAYFYARLSDDGNSLISTGTQVGKGNGTALGLPKHLRISPEARKQQVAERHSRWEQGMSISPRWSALKEQTRQANAKSQSSVQMSPPASPTTGAKVGLCLLIDFTDAPATIPQAQIDLFCNGDSYSGYGNNGSVKSYFYDVSNGQLEYRNVVTVYIRMSQPKSFYNDTTKDCGDQANLLIRDAIAIMRALPNYTTEILPTFDELDVDSSNEVIACNVFYAGGDGGVWSYGLWPHSWALVNVGAQDLGNGRKVFAYQITNIGSSLELGTFCHENGHMLCGFPDIYDYDYDSSGGAGGFCLMNSGGFGGNPVQVCAYLKRAAGWTTSTELSSSSSLTATLTSSAGSAFNNFYRYANPAAATEYFLLENRQKAGRDANIPASGIAVWHIDELGDRDNQSLATNTAHANYEVTLVQADNLWHFQGNINDGDANDLYYEGNSAMAYSGQFDDVSTPSAHWWNGTASGLRLLSFSGSGPTMTFQVGFASSLSAPVLASEPVATLGTGNTVSWGAVSAPAYSANPLPDSGAAESSAPVEAQWPGAEGLPFAVQPIKAVQPPSPAAPGADLTPYQPANWNDKLPLGTAQLAMGDPHTNAGPFYNNQVLYVNFAVANQGKADAGGYRIHLDISGYGAGDWDVVSHTKNTWLALSSDLVFGPLSAGSHTFSLSVDSTNGVSEADESNNQYQRTVTILDSASVPDLAPSRPANWSQKIPVEIAQRNASDEHMYTGRYFDNQTLFFNLQNVNESGTAAGPYRIHAEVTGTGGGTWNWDPASLAPGATWGPPQDIAVGPLSQGDHEIKVWLDYNGTVSECDELDNYYSRMISVEPHAIEYYVECADNPSFMSPLNSGWISATEYTFSGLIQGKTYWYRVKARRSAEESQWSTLQHSQQTVSFASIAGTVGYYSSYPPPATPAKVVSAVTMTLTNAAETISLEGTSGNDGTYSFPGLPEGDTESVTPSKTFDDSSGLIISVSDLVLMRRHFAGVYLTSPYQLLAADLDASGRIDLVDLVLMRRYLAGTAPTFAAGVWRFVPTNHIFSDPLNPWAAPRARLYSPLAGTQSGQDFLAIRVGDLDASWAPLAAAPIMSAQESPPAAVTFSVDHQFEQAGHFVRAWIKVRNFDQVTASQFTLSWDSNVLRFADITNYGLKGLSDQNFGLVELDQGKLRFFWYDPDLSGMTLPDDTRIFTVDFQIVGEPGSSSPLAVIDSPLARQVQVGFGPAVFLTSSDRVTAPSQPRMLSPFRENGKFYVSFWTEKGIQYVLQYASSPNSLSWSDLGFVEGDGALKTLVDPDASLSQGFYRVALR